MKRLNVFGMAILGMLFLSRMFNACQKDEALMQVQSDELSDNGALDNNRSAARDAENTIITQFLGS